MSTIVVGVDGSESARGALRFALQEARLRGAAVHAVIAWQLPAGVYEAALATVDVGSLGEELSAEAGQRLARALDEVADAVGNVTVERIVREGRPAGVLLDEATDADLLVLGSRGRGGFRGLLLGSVGQQCAHHAPCPLVIVPHSHELE
jgi:nucleotide-binding universal stress UspA family protein